MVFAAWGSGFRFGRDSGRVWGWVLELKRVWSLGFR